MKKTITLVVLLIVSFGFSQIKLLSWNVENLGKSKSDTNITFIANTINDYDVVALQEVVAGYGGAQAVAKLADELNRKGSKWDYIIQGVKGEFYPCKPDIFEQTYELLEQ